MSIRIAVAVACCLFVVVGAGSFVAAPAVSGPEAADFDRTVAMGMTLEEQRALGEDRFVPRAQVAYSQFPYVVGYRGIGLAASEVDDPLVVQQFGYPQRVYVEGVPADVTLGESGYPIGDTPASGSRQLTPSSSSTAPLERRRGRHRWRSRDANTPPPSPRHTGAMSSSGPSVNASRPRDRTGRRRGIGSMSRRPKPTRRSRS